MSAMAETSAPPSSGKRRVLVIILFILLAALIGGVIWLGNPNVLSRTLTSIIDLVNRPAETANTSAVSAALDSGDRLLVWTGTGTAPGKHDRTAAGKLVLMDMTGAVVQPVLDIPPQTNRVSPCGDRATSPDGRFFAFFVGSDRGTLYMLDEKQTLFPVNTSMQALGCLDGGSFRYSPDSARFAYLAYKPEAASNEFAEGKLHIVSTESLSDEAAFDGVTAFSMTNDVVAFVTFYTDEKGEADEAAISLWNGETDLEVATIFADEGCRFNSAQITILPNGKLIVLMGHRCRGGDGRTNWQFNMVDPSTRSATMSMSAAQPGGFFSYARTNNLFLSPDGSTVYFTVPDGITASTVSVIAVNMQNISPNNVVISNNTVMPKYASDPYDFAENAKPLISPDGRWLALVTNTANSEAALNLIDMNNPALPPITLAAGRRGDTIADMAFTPDSRRIVFIGGGPNGGDNSLFGVELDAGTDFRIRRGSYAHMALSPDGSTVAAVEWQNPDDTRQPRYLNLLLVDVNTAKVTPLAEGATLVDGKVTDPRFAYPLTWRRQG